MELEAEQLQALEELGTALNQAAWKPYAPDTVTFGWFEDKLSAAQKLGASFLDQYETELRKVLCEGGKPKSSVSTTADIIAAIGEVIASTKGLPGTVTIANCLAKYRLEKFCSLPAATPA